MRPPECAKADHGPGESLPSWWAAALVMVVAVGLAYRLALAHCCVPGGPAWRLSDDMFYYLKIAQHISLGHGATFDGLNPTNGFHPLYALILAGLFRTGLAPTQVPVAALSLLAVADAATGLLLYLILRRRGMTAGGVAACLLWMLNVEAIGISYLGVETPIATALLAASLCVYLGWREAARSSTRGLAAAGLLIGLAALTRTDSFLMAFALGVDALLKREEAPLRAALARACLPLALAVLVASPWFVWNIATFGAIGQVSAKALIYRQQASAWLTALDRLQAAGLGELPAHLLLATGWLLYSLAKIPNWFIRLSGMLQPTGLFWLVVGSGGLLWASDRASRGRAAWVGSDLGRPLVLFLALVGVAYALAYHHAHRWYFQSSIMVCCLLAGLAAEDIWRRTEGPRRLMASQRWWRAAVLGACLLLAAAVFNQLQQPFNELKPWNGAWTKIDAVVPEGAVVGAFNSGQLGYYSARRVVNLDGVVNNQAYEAMRKGRLWDYMRRQGIDYLADDPGYIRKFRRYGGPGYMEGASRVELPGGGTVYRLPWAKVN